MSRSRRNRQRMLTIAAWLCDAFGDDDETTEDFRPYADDFVNYMKAQGWEYRPAIMVVRGGQAQDVC